MRGRLEEATGHDRRARVVHQPFRECGRIVDAANARKDNRADRGYPFKIAARREELADEVRIRPKNLMCARVETVEMLERERAQPLGDD